MSCHQLDEYLCGLLNEELAADFQEHLTQCSTCAEAVQADADLMSTLRLASHNLEMPPAELQQVAFESVRHSPTVKPVSRAIVVALTACCLLLIAFGLAVMVPRPKGKVIDTGQVVETDDTSKTNTIKQSTEQQPRSPSVSVASNHLAFEVESSDPNITIVMLYPNNQQTEQP